MRSENTTIAQSTPSVCTWQPASDSLQPKPRGARLHSAILQRRRSARAIVPVAETNHRCRLCRFWLEVLSPAPRNEHDLKIRRAHTAGLSTTSADWRRQDSYPKYEPQRRCSRTIARSKSTSLDKVVGRLPLCRHLQNFSLRGRYKSEKVCAVSFRDL